MIAEKEVGSKYVKIQTDTKNYNIPFSQHWGVIGSRYFVKVTVWVVDVSTWLASSRVGEMMMALKP
jgi:hypothetical protein